jgi:hypothetical protein
LEKKRKPILEKKWKKKRKLEKKYKNKKKSTVNYCCNQQWFRCGGPVIPSYYLDIINMGAIKFNNTNKFNEISYGVMKFLLLFY